LEKLNLQQELIERCKAGNRDAQFKLYNMYSKAMYNICLRMLKTEMDAQDVLQMAFVNIFKNIGRYEYRSTPGAWIKRIVINHCLTHLRKTKMYFEEIDERLEIVEEEVQEPDYNVDIVKKAVSNLADGYRAVFTLYAFEGYDHKEIAEILDTSEANSKSQYSRAKAQVKRIIMENYRDKMSI